MLLSDCILSTDKSFRGHFDYNLFQLAYTEVTLSDYKRNAKPDLW